MDLFHAGEQNKSYFWLFDDRCNFFYYFLLLLFVFTVFIVLKSNNQSIGTEQQFSPNDNGWCGFLSKTKLKENN